MFTNIFYVEMVIISVNRFIEVKNNVFDKILRRNFMTCNCKKNHDHNEKCGCNGKYNDGECKGNSKHHDECQCNKGHNHEEGNMMTITLEDGIELNCEVVTILEVDNKEYIALLPEGGEGVYLYGYKETEKGPKLSMIEDDKFDKVAGVYNTMLEEPEEA